ARDRPGPAGQREHMAGHRRRPRPVRGLRERGPAREGRPRDRPRQPRPGAVVVLDDEGRAERLQPGRCRDDPAPGRGGAASRRLGLRLHGLPARPGPALLLGPGRLQRGPDPGPDPRLAGVLASQVDRRTALSREIVDSLRERFGDVVMQTMIRESVRVAEAPGHRLPVTIYAPDSSVAEYYRAPAAEFDARSAADGQTQADGRLQRAR